MAENLTTFVRLVTAWAALRLHFPMVLVDRGPSESVGMELSLSLAILNDPTPDAVVARLRTPSQEWVEACTGEPGTFFPVIDIDSGGYQGKGGAVGWSPEPAEIFAGHYGKDDVIPASCNCIGVCGSEYHLMEMPTGEISVYDPNGWDSASGMASAHEFASAAR
ncbi:hypothetical protein ACOKM3_13355 [Streptomyces sp. BH106]|uniref:hypothetical protein n=1 Tax=Streptomyces sp. BH106 TaxID=3410409 RepID=UPI003CEF7277